MALFFNLQTLEEESCNEPFKFLAMLYFHWKGIKYPRNSKDLYKPSKRSLAGSSFILNPKGIFDDRSDPLFRVQYIKLAARRDYALYRNHRLKTLPISYFPELNIEAAKQNPLLTVTKQEIILNLE